ncbi:SGNH hydrolase-type esterase domain-containing protein [Apodospora peruviana]|uniref:SGNH hydrolase-type esterase domain-containing protein n=1 Tax=Apodospora peruviana TaxID=516989 RepID=A0AAE0HUT8_9PEZI|nr:SGNH hydrolase-type esterase domain-containing protein [Apodospora peruviana]
MRIAHLVAVQAVGLAAVEAYVMPYSHAGNASAGGLTSQNRQKKRSVGKRDDDPSDFSWVKRWAAVGDSYTAGIGSGKPLGNPIMDTPENTNWYCSRYDTAWPVIVNDALGSSVEDFYFVGCSGDRTGGIYNQIKALEGDLDLVMMTAGGNDLCLAKLIEKCVLVPSGDSSCDNVIKTAQANMESILKDNMKQLMAALDEKMNDDGIVIYNGYAQFFNTESEACANQAWTYATLWPGNSGLTISRRQIFNDFVVQINNIIRSVVEETAANTAYKWKIGYSNWDPWVYDGVQGQMCDPDGTGDYPDKDQPDLQFFKPDTQVSGDDADADPKRRWEEYGPLAEKRRAAIADVERRNLETELYNSLLFNSVNPRAEVKHRLDRRGMPSPPKCPGDTDDDIQPKSIGLPDWVGKNFHPNELGHYTIASFALQTLVDTRAAVLDMEPPSCEIADKFTCWQTTGSKQYAAAKQLNEDYKDFCDKQVKRPTGATDGWKFSHKYHEGTPDETEFTVKVAAPSTNFDRKECNDKMWAVINNCDGNDPQNPLNFKFGGEFVHGDYTYTVSPQKKKRHWPVPKETGGACKGWWHGWWSSYVMWGYGWAGHDHGQQTLLSDLKKTTGCIGGGVTLWRFKYFDEPDENGMEWQADFNTPIWVRQRCFNNNKVQRAAGGFTGGCGGND